MKQTKRATLGHFLSFLRGESHVGRYLRQKKKGVAGTPGFRQCLLPKPLGGRIHRKGSSRERKDSSRITKPR